MFVVIGTWRMETQFADEQRIDQAADKLVIPRGTGRACGEVPSR